MTARLLPLIRTLCFSLGMVCTVCNGQAQNNPNPKPPIGDPFKDICLVDTGKLSCQGKFNNPGPLSWCSTGQLCDAATRKCPGNQIERRNNGNWLKEYDSSRRANKGEPGWFANEITMICTATRPCVCIEFTDEDHLLGDYYCVLGPDSSQVNEKTFTFGVSSGGGPCVGR